MMMKNNQKPIKNLNDLRLAKKRLKAEIRISEKANDNSVVNKAFGLVSNFTRDQNFASSKVESALHWIGDKASNKYPMRGFSKILVSGLIVIAVPIITEKIQDYIKKKL
ncbi:hypothetical protein [Faecalibacter bovis]|uniref:Uncharacterized protein n=1 Tax=Faecalibacter bovis TaxID=2898187 RepID=A0ABX7XB39_9FLAO|nr:hypothetical protein [Faecalibacter bovis]QTV05118.1 hypothetical protein J9309_09985 [Faecalibacter bovis]